MSDEPNHEDAQLEGYDASIPTPDHVIPDDRDPNPNRPDLAERDAPAPDVDEHQGDEKHQADEKPAGSKRKGTK